MILLATEVEQEKIDDLLMEHVNRVIQEIFKNKLKGMAFDEVREVFPKDAIFCKKVRSYLPKSYPVNLAGEAFLSAYYMVKSSTLYLPDPITAYVINAVLQKEIELRKAVGISLHEPAVECDGVLDELSEIVVQTQEEADQILKDINYYRSRKLMCEDISRYPELCEIDENTEYLDILSEKRLIHMIKEKDKSKLCTVERA